MIVNESFLQYIPKPLFHKRFSSSRIRIQAERTYSEFYEVFVDKESSRNIFLTWGYFHQYETTTDMENHYINLPYYYLDHSFLLPSLSHESMHLAICDIELAKDKDKDKIIQLRNDLSGEILNILKKNLSDFTYSFPKNKVVTYKMSEEIIADIMAYFQDGPSYILTFVHLNLGLEFSNHYMSSEGKISDRPNHSFSYLKDFNIIRLFVLIQLHQAQKYNYKYPILKEYMREISIYCNEQTKELSEFKGKDKDLQSIQETKIVILGIINDFIGNNKSIFQDIKKKIKKEAPETISNDVWKKRLELLVDDRSMCNIHTRKILHKELIDELYVEGIGEEYDNIKPYKLIYAKLSHSIYCEEGIVEDIYKRINKNEGISPKNIESKSTSYNLFGIYDFCVLIEKEDSVKINDKINEDIENINYHTFHHSIMNIMKPSHNGNKKGSFFLIIQILLSYHDYKMNEILTFLRDLKCNIIEGNIQKNQDVGAVQYFKSLGQGDIVIVADYISLDAIYELKNELSKLQLVSKTFSSISYSKNQKDQDIIISPDYSLITIFKIKTSKTSLEEIISKIYDLCKDEKIRTISTIVGVMDIQIVWCDENIDFKQIKLFYGKICDTFKEDENIRIVDIQTSVGKKYPLKKNNSD